MKIAICSIDQAWGDKTLNKMRCSDALLPLQDEGISLIVFPEMTLTSFSSENHTWSEELNKSESILFFSKMSEVHRAVIVFGMLLDSERQVTNSAIAVNGLLGSLCRYDKVHLFSHLGEDKCRKPGESLKTFEVQGIRMGLSICYDLRFPEIFAALAQHSQAILNVANWPDSRRDHWLCLLRARAIENQVYVFGVNRTGVDEKRNQYSGSVVFDPNGIEVVPQKVFGNVSIFDIASHQFTSSPLRLKSFSDRRNHFYSSTTVENTLFPTMSKLET